MRVLALQHVRDAAGVLDHLEPALDVALRVVDHLAVLGAEQVGELVAVGLDQLLEGEHHPRAPLRVGHRPVGLHRLRRRDRAVEQRRVAERDARLNLAGRGVHTSL